MVKYVCIHGHFYQPPRENPWLEAVELQDSASPYHDWNERITAECYAPNAAARILEIHYREQSKMIMEKAASNASSTITPASVSTSAPPSSPGWKKRRRIF